MERDEFCFILDKEVRKISSLYGQQLTELKSDINQLDNEIKSATANGKLMEFDTTTNTNDHATSSSSNNSLLLVQTYFERYKRIGEEVLELHAFVGANITALRQILIRYDSLIRTMDGPPLGQWYIVTRREVFVNEEFEAIFVRHGLLLLTDTFTFALRNLQSLQYNIADDIDVDDDDDDDDDVVGESTTMNGSGDGVVKKPIIGMNQQIDNYINGLYSDIGEMESVILRAERAVDKALRSRLAFTDSIVYTLRYFFLAGSVMNELVMQPSFIRTRGLKLKDEIRFFAKWRTDRTSLPYTKPRDGIRDLLHVSLLLNFVSQFLYMMNHYIIEPSSTQVCVVQEGKGTNIYMFVCFFFTKK